MRLSPGGEWMEPVIAGAGTDASFESREDAEMIAESLLDQASPGAAVAVLRDGEAPQTRN